MAKNNLPITASRRLQSDYLQIKKDPIPYLTAEPLPSNILEWHYVVSHWLMIKLFLVNEMKLDKYDMRNIIKA